MKNQKNEVWTFRLVVDPVQGAYCVPFPDLNGRSHHPDADRALRPLPFRDDFVDGGIVGIDRLDDREPVRMFQRHFDRVARVIAIQRKRRDEDRAINADLVHRRHHLVAGDMRRPVRHAVPRAARCVGLVGVDLGIDDHVGNSC